MMQSEHHAIYRLMAGPGAQAEMEQTDGEDCREWRLTTVDPQERST